MPVSIGEVQVDAPAQDGTEPRAQGGAAPASTRPARPDPEEVRTLLRREEDRALRLQVD